MTILRKLLRNKSALLSFLEKLVADVVLFNLSTLIAVWMRFDYSLKMSYVHMDDPLGILENIVFIIFVFAFKMPMQIWRYTSTKEVLDVAYAVTFTKIISAVFFYVFRSRIVWSRGAYLISWIVALLLLTGVRLFVRRISEKRNVNARTDSGRREKNILIIGAGDAGEKVIREIVASPNLNYRIVGILDDDKRKKGGKIHGYTVFGEIDRLPYVVNEMGVDIVLAAIPSASKELLRKVVSLASGTPAEVKTLPGIWEIIGGRVHVSDIRNVQLEDLLSRPSIKTDTASVKKYIKNSVVLVTGAGGSIGSEIVRQVAMFSPDKIILLDKGENGIFTIERELVDERNFRNEISVICDIRDRDKVFRIFEEHKPDIIFHTAAHKHVPLMESNPDEAVTNNIFGTKNLLDAAVKYGVGRFVNISTDKAVDPTSIMGASKRVTEKMVQYYAKDNPKAVFTSVRFGNVLGSAGSVIEVFKRQIKGTGTLTVTDPKMERYFMLIPEAVQLVLQAGALGDGGEIFVLKMGDRVNVLELAKTFAKLSGFEVGKDVQIKITGNRGGEKIIEELWAKEEAVEDTENPYILRIRPDDGVVEKEEFFEILDQLKVAAVDMDFDKVRKIFMEIIPEAKLK
jgi:FlaA1/EpsC-like NDP-sugar epimerase